MAAPFALAGSPSQSKPVGFASSPKGRALGITVKFSGIAQRRPLGGAGERSEPEGVASARSKAALQMPSPVTTPPVKMGYRNARRRSDIPKFKIILPLMMPRAQRRAF